MGRIEALEIQNYNLISYNAQCVEEMKSYIDDIVENLEILYDIQRVINQVYDTQAITKEFLIIRDTLNNKDDFIAKQKEAYLSEKEKLETSALYHQNMDVLLCKDKNLELNKQMTQENEDRGDDILLHDNYILKTNNIRLRNLLVDILKDNSNMNLSPNIIDELNYMMNTNYDVILSGDLLSLLNSQAKLIEENLFK
jgi:hypothetical protein